jgi:hypothetical protein
VTCLIALLEENKPDTWFQHDGATTFAKKITSSVMALLGLEFCHHHPQTS